MSDFVWKCLASFDYVFGREVSTLPFAAVAEKFLDRAAMPTRIHGA